MAPEVPPAFKELEPDLLIHSDWEKLPPARPSWWLSQLEWLQQKLEGWRDWSVLEWMYAITFVSMGLGLMYQVMQLLLEVTRHRHPN
jgi:hypothetical protein